MNTLMKSDTSDRVCAYIQQNPDLFSSFDQVYLFGSMLDTGKAPNDMDILLIYTEYSSEIVEDLKDIRATLEGMSRLPVDLTVLSVEEEKETGFLKRIWPRVLKLK